MTSIHTAHGIGTIVDQNTVRGRTQFKVAGDGFSVWLDEVEVNKRTASDEGLFSTVFEPGQVGEQEKIPGIPNHTSPKPGHGMYGAREEHEASASFDFEPTDHVWDNHTTLPYNWQPQYPVEMFNHEQTISPDHQIDIKERMHDSDSRTGEDREPTHTYPGPNPDLFAKNSKWHVAEVEDDPYNQIDPSYHNRVDSVKALADHLRGTGRNLDSIGSDELWHVINNEMPPEHHGELSNWLSNFAGERNPQPEPMIPPEHRAQPGEPSWQDHVQAEGEHQDNLNFGPHQPEHPDHLGSYRPAGLSSKYADIIDAADHYNDPIQRFRDDPKTAIQRHAYIDISAGLDHETGEWMNLVEADKSIRTAAWNDVRQKAMRLKRDGAVHVKDMSPDHIYANVDGDNGRYEVMILKGSSYGGMKGKPTGQAIADWKCSCDWGKWAFKRQMTYVGRLCSHGYASYLTMQGHSAKEPGHPFRKHWGSVEDFKKWVKDENGDHIDTDAADSYLSTLDEPATKEDAQAVFDYVEDHHSERPERDYDQDGYSNDPEDAYKTAADVLQHQPGKLTPHLYVVPEGEEQHFTDLGDDRKTTGPDQIQARRRRAKGADAISEHHPDFAWHNKGEDDFPEQGIVHFSRHALIYTADEDLLNKLRDLSQEQPSEHFHDMQDHNREVSEVVEELHDRGYAASPLVAMKRQAMWKTAFPPGTYGHDVDADGNPLPLPSQDTSNNPTGGSVLGIPRSQAGPGPGGSEGHTPETPGVEPAAAVGPAPGGGSSNPIAPINQKTPGGGGVFTPDNPNAGTHGMSEQMPGPGGSGAGAINPSNGVGQVGKGPGYGGAGFQGGGSDWAKSNETTGIGAGEHTVAPGETVSDIQNRAGGGAVSGISGDMIHPGDKYTVGPSGTPGTTSPPNYHAPVQGPGLSGNPGGPVPSIGNANGGKSVDYKSLYQTPAATPPATPAAAPSGPSGPPKTTARRFAERYFFGADDDDNDPDKKNTGGSSAPSVNSTPVSTGPSPANGGPAPQGPVGKGSDYLTVSPAGAKVNQPRATAEDLKATPGSAGGTTAPNALTPGSPGMASDRSQAVGGTNPIAPGSPADIHGGSPAPGAPAPDAAPAKRQEGGGAPGVGGMDINNVMQQVMPAVSGVMSMIPGLGGGGGLGGLAGGLGGLMHGLHLGAQDFAAQYMYGGTPAAGMAQPTVKPTAKPAAGQPASQTGAPQPTAQSTASAIVGEIPNLLSGGGSGFGLGTKGVGGLTKGMGGITKTMSAQHYARQYMAGGDFLTKGGPDWMDFPFSGSGPDRQDFSGTSQDYVEKHERPNRQETWRTDDDGDIIKYTGTQPKQAARFAERYFYADGDIAGSGDAGFGSLPGGTSGGATLSPSGSGMGVGGGSYSEPASPSGIGLGGGVTASLSESGRQFWADAFDPGQRGYYNPANRPYQEDDSEKLGLPKPKGKGKAPGAPGNVGPQGVAAEVAPGAGAVSEIAEAAPALIGASYGGDDSDVVRRFHASGAGALGAPTGGSNGAYSDDAIATSARKMIRTAGRHFTPAEERELEDEFHPRGARNLGSLDLTGTHYLDD